MNITTTRKAVKDPSAYSTTELHEALDVLVNDERFTEKQVANGQYAIEAELTKREKQGGRIRPAHTPISDIRSFDRSNKVFFECSIHPESKWMSKQPSVSQWFPRTYNGYDCGCPMQGDTWWTSTKYLEPNPASKPVWLGVGHDPDGNQY